MAKFEDCALLQKPRTITKRKLEPPLPMPFELPKNYKPVVMSELDKGFLSGKGKTKFIADVAAAIFRFKSYPTNEEKQHVAHQIVSKYPFLRSSLGTGYVS